MATTEERMLGNDFLKAGNYRKAIECYSQGIEIDPKDYMLYSNRSVAHLYLKNYDLAIADANKVIELKSNWYKGYLRKCKALIGKNELITARSVVKQGLKACPSNGELLKLFKVMAGKNGDTQPSPRKNVGEKIDVSKDKAKGNKFYKEKRYEKALEMYDRAISGNPDIMMLYLNKASCFMALKRYEDAIRMCERSLVVAQQYEEDPKMHIKALYRWGNVLLSQKKFTEAFEKFKEAQLIGRSKAVGKKISEVKQLIMLERAKTRNLMDLNAVEKLVDTLLQSRKTRVSEDERNVIVTAFQSISRRIIVEDRSKIETKEKLMELIEEYLPCSHQLLFYRKSRFLVFNDNDDIKWSFDDPADKFPVPGQPIVEEEDSDDYDSDDSEIKEKTDPLIRCIHFKPTKKYANVKSRPEWFRGKCLVSYLDSELNVSIFDVQRRKVLKTFKGRSTTPDLDKDDEDDDDDDDIEVHLQVFDDKFLVISWVNFEEIIFIDLSKAWKGSSTEDYCQKVSPHDPDSKSFHLTIKPCVITNRNGPMLVAVVSDSGDMDQSQNYLEGFKIGSNDSITRLENGMSFENGEYDKTIGGISAAKNGKICIGLNEGRFVITEWKKKIMKNEIVRFKNFKAEMLMKGLRFSSADCVGIGKEEEDSDESSPKFYVWKDWKQPPEEYTDPFHEEIFSDGLDAIEEVKSDMLKIIESDCVVIYDLKEKKIKRKLDFSSNTDVCDFGYLRYLIPEAAKIHRVVSEIIQNFANSIRPPSGSSYEIAFKKLQVLKSEAIVDPGKIRKEEKMKKVRFLKKCSKDDKIVSILKRFHSMLTVDEMREFVESVEKTKLRPEFKSKKIPKMSNVVQSIYPVLENVVVCKLDDITIGILDYSTIEVLQRIFVHRAVYEMCETINGDLIIVSSSFMCQKWVPVPLHQRKDGEYYQLSGKLSYRMDPNLNNIVSIRERKSARYKVISIIPLKSGNIVYFVRGSFHEVNYYVHVCSWELEVMFEKVIKYQGCNGNPDDPEPINMMRVNNSCVAIVWEMEDPDEKEKRLAKMKKKKEERKEKGSEDDDVDDDDDYGYEEEDEGEGEEKIVYVYKIKILDFANKKDFIREFVVPKKPFSILICRSDHIIIRCEEEEEKLLAISPKNDQIIPLEHSGKKVTFFNPVGKNVLCVAFENELVFFTLKSKSAQKKEVFSRKRENETPQENTRFNITYFKPISNQNLAVVVSESYGERVFIINSKTKKIVRVLGGLSEDQTGVIPPQALKMGFPKKKKKKNDSDDSDDDDDDYGNDDDDEEEGEEGEEEEGEKILMDSDYKFQLTPYGMWYIAVCPPDNKLLLMGVNCIQLWDANTGHKLGFESQSMFKSRSGYLSNRKDELVYFPRGKFRLQNGMLNEYWGIRARKLRVKIQSSKELGELKSVNVFETISDALSKKKMKSLFVKLDSMVKKYPRKMKEDECNKVCDESFHIETENSLFSILSGGTPCTMNVRTGKLNKFPSDSILRTATCAMDIGRDQMIVGGYGKVWLMSLPNVEISQLEQEHDQVVTSMCRLENGYFATASTDIIIWNSKMEPATQLKYHKAPVKSLVFHKGNLYSGSSDGCICWWELRRENFHEGPVATYWTSSARSHSSLSCMESFGDDQGIIFVRMGDSKVKYVNMKSCDDPNAVEVCAHEDGVVNDIKVFPESNLLVSCSNDRTVVVWEINREDVKKTKFLHTLFGHEDSVMALCKIRKNVVASISPCESIRIWNVAEGSFLRGIPIDERIMCSCLVFGPFLLENMFMKQLALEWKEFRKENRTEIDEVFRLSDDELRENEDMFETSQNALWKKPRKGNGGDVFETSQNALGKKPRKKEFGETDVFDTSQRALRRKPKKIDNDAFITSHDALRKKPRKNEDGEEEEVKKKDGETKKVEIKTLVLDLLGKGAFGHVYKAVDDSGFTGRRGMFIAMKKIDLRLINQSEHSEKILKYFYQEIDLLKRMKSKYVIKYFGMQKEENEINIFTEYCSEGTILRQFNKFKGMKMKTRAAKSFFRYILEGIRYIHDEVGIFHRDILINQNGVIKIADFGCSREISSKFDTATEIGTRAYFSPQFLFGHPKSKKELIAVDMWALGISFVEVLTNGRRMFKIRNDYELGVTYKKLMDDPNVEYPPIPEEIDDEELRDVLKGALMLDDQKRKTATQLLEYKFFQT